MTAPAGGRTVLVTGASGYIAGFVIAELLARGHSVVGTVRDASAVPETCAHLLALSGARRRLSFVPFDLVADSAADLVAAVGGAGPDAVMHVASPYRLTAADPQRDLVEPAVRGTETVLAAVERWPAVRHVTVTSSGSAMTDNGGLGMDETWWNADSSLARSPYKFSKVCAERAATAWAAAHPAVVVARVNPFLTVGPVMTPRHADASSASALFCICASYPYWFRGIPALEYAIVDVRDVALAHVEAMEQHEGGRFIVGRDATTLAEVREMILAAHPEVEVPGNAIRSWVMRIVGWLFWGPGEYQFLTHNLDQRYRFRPEEERRLQSVLGVRLRPAAESVHELIKQGLANGVITARAN